MVTIEASLLILILSIDPGSAWLPSTDGCRIVVATWVLVSLVIMSSYSGTLVAKLMIPKVNIPIDSVQDLVSQTELEYQIENGFMVQFYKVNNLYNSYMYILSIQCPFILQPIIKVSPCHLYHLF